MKQFLIALLGYALVLGAASFWLFGCSVTRAQVPPDLRELYDAKVAALVAAQETPEPEDDEAAEAELRELEEVVIERNTGPLARLLPGGLAVIALEAAKVAGSSRVRRHYGNAVRNVARGQVWVAIGDVMRGLGAAHSSPASAAASQQPSQQV